MSVEIKVPWDDLPIVNGEESDGYARAMHKYSHVGCPGARYEDNCEHPAECALRGRCRELWERQQ